MMLQQAPADTFTYMVLGFAVILGAIALFLVSLVARARNLKRDLALLAELEKSEKA
jgi:hypothetical protein